MASDDVNLSLLTTVFFWENSFARYAVVTGANKGLGWGIVKLLASTGVMVVLTARDETRGLEAVEKLNESGLSDHVVFHLLDVMDPASIASLADFNMENLIFWYDRDLHKTCGAKVSLALIFSV